MEKQSVMHEVLIVGGGPAGSTLATYLTRSGINVGIVESENFPRFHIGESLLPASMPILKETGFYPILNSGKYIRKYGARFVDHHSEDEIYFGFDGGLNPDIPMAFEVERDAFDRDLLDHAKNSGAIVYQPERVKEVHFSPDSVHVESDGRRYECKYLVDASGRDCFIAKKLGLRNVRLDLNNVAVFAHFVGVERHRGKHEGDITIGLIPDQAWSWIIPFAGEKTSVGVVCNSRNFQSGTDLAAHLQSKMKESKRLETMMEKAERVTDFMAISNYSHVCSRYYGDRWMMIGDAASFLDPIFSNGVHVGLMSAKLSANTLTLALKENVSLTTGNLGEKYEQDLNRGIGRFHKLVSLFYKTNFVAQMKKTLQRENMRQAFTSAVAGDMWDDQNILFQMDVL